MVVQQQHFQELVENDNIYSLYKSKRQIVNTY